jgi:hypothetical protein
MQISIKSAFFTKDEAIQYGEGAKLLVLEERRTTLLNDVRTVDWLVLSIASCLSCTECGLQSRLFKLPYSAFKVKPIVEIIQWITTHVFSRNKSVDYQLTIGLFFIFRILLYWYCRLRWSNGLPLDPKFAGSNPTEEYGFLRSIKICNTTPLGGREVKQLVPYRKILRLVK